MNEPVIVSGLSAEPLDVESIVARIRVPGCGGVVTFEGRTRSPDGGAEVLRLEYEAYERRAVAQLEAITREVAARYGLGGAVAVHRVGGVPAGEVSVVAAASAPHRDEAFAATREIIDRIKAEAAIWKKEVTAGGEAWAGVPGNDGLPAGRSPA